MKNFIIRVVILICSLVRAVASEGYFKIDNQLTLRLAADNQISVKIPYNQPVCLLGTKGLLVVMLIENENSDRTSYRAKTLDYSSGLIEETSGILFEKYQRTQSSSGMVNLVDDGSSLIIKSALGNLEWSYAGGGMGFIYYISQDWRMVILPYNSFDDIRLSHSK